MKLLQSRRLDAEAESREFKTLEKECSTNIIMKANPLKTDDSTVIQIRSVGKARTKHLQMTKSHQFRILIAAYNLLVGKSFDCHQNPHHGRHR
jgi:hypothetical protein